MQRQGMQYPIENAVLIPLRKPAMAGRIGRILVRHLRPLCAGTQNPQHPIENVARVAPRSTAFFARANLFRLGNVRSNDLPLLVGDVHDQPTNTSSDEWKDPCKRWNNIDRLRTARGYGMRSSRFGASRGHSVVVVKTTENNNGLDGGTFAELLDRHRN